MSALLALGSGCCPGREARVAPAPDQWVQAAPERFPSPVLLFDRWPGIYDASQFARGDWPSTESFHPLGEVIYYREHFIDQQGPHHRLPDRAYRRFETHRSGAGFR